jgi:hypothetical protein
MKAASGLNGLLGWYDAGDIKLNFPEMREETLRRR